MDLYKGIDMLFFSSWRTVKNAHCIPAKVILSGIVTETGEKSLERWKISLAKESLCFP